MEVKSIYFDKNSSQAFLKWTALDLQSVTWQGHFAEDFKEFWSALFDNAEIHLIFKRFNVLILYARIGTLYNWVNWLRVKFLIYCFVNRGFTIMELKHFSGMDLKQIFFELRDFFIKCYPQKSDEIGDIFHLPHPASQKAHISYSDLTAIGINQAMDRGSLEDDPMIGLEVTLYPEWESILARIKNYLTKSVELKEKKKLLDQFYFKYLLHLFVLTILGLIIVFIMTVVSRHSETVLAEQFEIFEPKFTWLDKALVYKEKQNSPINIDPNAFDEIEHIISRELENYSPQEEERYDTESEALLTSWDSIPKDLAENNEGSANQTDSGFRDVSTGNRKIFRLMMKSVVPLNTKDMIYNLITKYKGIQGDGHALGTFVPGGVYYNTLIPNDFLKEFLAQAFEIDESVLYESKTRIVNPPGKTRVLIWIKSI